MINRNVVFSSCALALLLFAILACRSTNLSNGPSWTKLKVLSDKEDHPSKIVTDGDAVYFITGGTVALTVTAGQAPAGGMGGGGMGGGMGGMDY